MQTQENREFDVDLVVIGGGLAGLSATALVASAGRSVFLFEQASDLGGRAATRVRQGISFNLGAHALYYQGHASRLFRELQIPFTGDFPNPGNGRLLTGKADHPLPRGLASLVGSRLFSLREKGRLIRLLVTLDRVDARSFDGKSLSDWVLEALGSGNAAAFLH